MRTARKVMLSESYCAFARASVQHRLVVVVRAAGRARLPPRRLNRMRRRRPTPSARRSSSIRASREFFAAHMTGVNNPLAAGDPVVAQVQTLNGPLPGPFAGQSINCRSCHFVTEFQGVTGAGNRTYSDFTTRSPIPRARSPTASTTRRATPCRWWTRSPARSGPLFLHFDGEFASGEDLVVGTMTGRNFGWLPSQYNAGHRAYRAGHSRRRRQQPACRRPAGRAQLLRSSSKEPTRASRAICCCRLRSGWT